MMNLQTAGLRLRQAGLNVASNSGTVTPTPGGNWPVSARTRQSLRIPVVVYRELAQFGFLFLVVAMVASDLGVWMSRLSLHGAQFLLGLVR